MVLMSINAFEKSDHILDAIEGLEDFPDSGSLTPDKWLNEREYRMVICKKHVEAFIKKVREYNPDATILCSFGIVGAGLYPSIELAVNNYMNETGDYNIDLLKFDQQMQSDGYAADWHPTEATHLKATEKLVAKIQEIQGR